MRWFRRDESGDEVEEAVRMVQHAAQVHGVPNRQVVQAVLDEDEDELDDEPGYGPGRRRIGLWITAVVVGGVFCLGVGFLWRLANSAAEAGPSADAGIKGIEKSIQPSPPNLPTLTGQYVAFSYPQVFDSVKTLNNLPNTAERYAIGSKSNYRRSIIVTVENNTATLEEDSGYKYRKLNPALYREEDVKLSAGPGVVMTKNDNTEKTLYWAHGGKAVVISVTSSDAMDDLGSYLAVIISTIRWAG